MKINLFQEMCFIELSFCRFGDDNIVFVYQVVEGIKLILLEFQKFEIVFEDVELEGNS